MSVQIGVVTCAVKNHLAIEFIHIFILFFHKLMVSFERAIIFRSAHILVVRV